jgi:hypothetical protein
LIDNDLLIVLIKKLKKIHINVPAKAIQVVMVLMAILSGGCKISGIYISMPDNTRLQAINALENKAVLPVLNSKPGCNLLLKHADSAVTLKKYPEIKRDSIFGHFAIQPCHKDNPVFSFLHKNISRPAFFSGHTARFDDNKSKSQSWILWGAIFLALAFFVYLANIELGLFVLLLAAIFFLIGGLKRANENYRSDHVKPVFSEMHGWEHRKVRHLKAATIVVHGSVNNLVEVAGPQVLCYDQEKPKGTIQILEGQLPPGLSFDESRLQSITGIATKAGRWKVHISVTNIKCGTETNLGFTQTIIFVISK